jgi:hypothetical protein
MPTPGPRRCGAATTVAAFLAAQAPGCGPSCSPAYSGDENPLPEDAFASDCTVTFVGTANTGSYDCPALGSPNDYGFADCTAQGGAPQLPVAHRFGAEQIAQPPPATAGWIQVDFEDSSEQATASEFRSWLGGPAFSYSVACAGVTVAEVESQSIGKQCAD